MNRTNQILTALGVLLLTSCGGKEGSPDGTIITFNPASYTWTNSDPAASCYFGTPALHQIILKSPSGTPLNGATLTIFVDAAFAQLYDDKNDNLILDADEMTPIAGGSLVTKTKTYGSKTIFVAAKLGGTACSGNTAKGLEYTMDVSVFSGSNYAISTHTITSEAPP